MSEDNVFSIDNTKDGNEKEKLQDNIQPIIDSIQNLENPKKSIYI